MYFFLNLHFIFLCTFHLSRIIHPLSRQFFYQIERLFVSTQLLSLNLNLLSFDRHKNQRYSRFICFQNCWFKIDSQSTRRSVFVLFSYSQKPFFPFLKFSQSRLKVVYLSATKCNDVIVFSQIDDRRKGGR